MINIHPAKVTAGICVGKGDNQVINKYMLNNQGEITTLRDTIGRRKTLR